MGLGSLLIILPLLVQCTLPPQILQSEAPVSPSKTTTITTVAIPLSTATLSLTETPPPSTPTTKPISSSMTPTPTQLASTPTSTLVATLETPIVADLNGSEEINTTSTPLIVSLAHVNPDTHVPTSAYTLYLMDLAGKASSQLIDSNIDHLFPSWSPNCSRIAFAGDSKRVDDNYYNRLFVMDIADGSIVEVVTSLNAYRNPRWSPDGSSIAFEGVDSESTQIYVYHLDSQKLARLTDDGNNYEPDWSPDGSQIVFTVDRDRNWQTSIHVMNTDGSAQVQLLPTSWGSDPSSFDNPLIYEPRSPIWSPDGNWIAFQATENAIDYEVSKIYVMTSNGQEPRPVAPGDRHNTDMQDEDFYYTSELNPRWAPDGNQILYMRSDWVTEDTYLCVADVFGGETTCNSTDRQFLILNVDWCSAMENR